MNTGVIICKICDRKIFGGIKTFNAHSLGKKHIHQLPAYVTVKVPCSSDKISSVHEYFEKFGTVSKHEARVEGGFVCVDYYFQDPKVYTDILHQDHQLFGAKLEISWSKTPILSNPTPPKVLKAEPLVTLNKPAASLSSVANTTTNLPESERVPPKTAQPGINKHKMANATTEEFRASILNSVKEAKTFSQQVGILQSRLQTTSEAEVEKNRSIIYGDLTGALAPMFPLHQIHFFGSSITGLDFKGSDLDVYVANVKQRNKPEVLTLKTIRMLIYKSRKFCDLLLISGAAVPIIKCIHTRTQICCDLNIRNKLSVANSRLIKYYLTLDEKIRPLMIIIKFWAECYNLKKVNFFSGYALYLMVIFFLQQEPYNLPSVYDLQKDCPPDVEDEWNCAFSTPENELSVLHNESLLNVVAGFFRFYSNFDYVTQAICPYLGRTVKKTAFLKPYNLPQSYQRYMSQSKVLQLNSGICIQDPFEHNRNVSSSIPLQYVGKFAILCNIAEQYFAQTETELLHKILTKCGGPLMNDVSFTIQKSDYSKDNQEWFTSLKDFTVKVLKDIIYCQISEIANSESVQVIDCVGQQNIWDNRVSVMKTLEAQLPPDTNDFDRELAIAPRILKYFPQVLGTKFIVTLTMRKDPFRVEFVMKLKSKCKIFCHVAHYIRLNLPLWLEDSQSDRIKEEIPELDGIKGEENPTNLISTESSVNSDMIKTDDKLNSENTVRKENSPGKHVEKPWNSPHPNPNENQVISDSVDISKTIENRAKEKSAEGQEPSEETEIYNEGNDDDEDVPADFFDDFSNQDFMDGLDIVDAWDEESGKPQEDDNSEEQAPKRKPHSPIRFSSKESYEKSSERRAKRPIDRNRSKSRSPLRRRKRSNSFGRKPKSRSKSRDKNIRRDPEKTKRDINKDKIKCAKDKEQKLVTDKLKIVETGLVPPGTEMDVDLASIMKDKRRSTGDSGERVKVKVDRERRYSRRSGSKESRKTARYSRSPPVYKPRPTRTEASYRRRRTSSVDSNASERELWIRSGRKRMSRSRSRDTSLKMNLRKRSRSRSRESVFKLKSRKYDDKPKKRSFLEEIRDKLNEMRPVPIVQYNHPNPMIPPGLPIPAPVPAPSQFFPGQNQNNPAMQQYDQRFFIGDAYPIGVGQAQNINMLGNITGNVVPLPQVQINPVSLPQMAVQAAPKLPVAQQSAVSPKVRDERSAKPVEQNDKQTTDDIDKLFADKKISLSDFLTITAKCEVQSASPEHLQKKIKVISRCQDVIKAMSDDRKFTGRLSVKPSLEGKSKPEVKYQSPLRRIPIVRFQFTSPAKASEEVDSFAAALDKILQRIGVLKETIDLDEAPEIPTKIATNSSFADEDTTALTLKASQLSSKTIAEVPKCEECKKRKLKVFSDVGSQCADANETVSIGIQVSEEELSPTKGLLKDSIAYLTPAQLLGKEKEKEVEKIEAAAPPPAEKVEKKKIEVPESALEPKKDKPKVVARGRGGFRGKSLRDRQYNNSFEFEDEFEYFERGRFEFEDPRETFGHRYGGTPVHYPRQFVDNGQRMNQLREDDGNLFTDFNQPYRGRNRNRFGPRY